MMDIIHLTNKQIDKQQWDALVGQSPDFRPYALSWYLDAVSPGWAALVAGQYQAVMPLPRARKYGLRYVRQPRFSQQLGVFSARPLDAATLQAFIAALPWHYVLLDLNFHSASPLPAAWQARLSERPNYLVDLRPGASELFAAYSINTRRNVRKTQREPFTLADGYPPKAFVAFKRRFATNLTEADYRRLVQLLAHGQQRNQMTVYVVKDDQQNVLAAAAFALAGKRRVMINNASSAEGMKRRAMFFLIDALVQQWAGQDAFLDFEGSQVPGVARFFAGFGAQPEYYHRLFCKAWMRPRMARCAHLHEKLKQ